MREGEGEKLEALAESHGIQTAYISELGERQVISDDAQRALLGVLGVDPQTGDKGGFSEHGERAQPCLMPDTVRARRFWGVACQLYALRSHRDLGIGDFADLARLAAIAAEAGASFVGVNPLHALFSAAPERFSPYSPSTRRFLNPLYIAVDELEGGPEAIEALRKAEPELFDGLDGELVDYGRVGRLKIRLLRDVFESRIEEIRDEQAFERFCAGGGDALRDFALFEAISQAQVAEGGHAGWHNWPEELRDRRSDAVAAFEAENADAVLFHRWLQFEADEQLAEAQARAKGAGMAIGLYLDLAVGVAPDGAETWADPELTVRSARVGSPPDMFNSAGQDWGLAPLSPKALAERDYKPLREAFDALTSHAGAVRIDHAMGLARLWWIPEGEQSKGGGYVRYPLASMIDAVSDASRANRCIVIGEDLGTVPPGFRHTMEEANILSYRVLYFERHRGSEFLPPSAYPQLALACISTHDLPTLAGWWTGEDVTLRASTGRQDEAATDRDRHSRERDRIALLLALKEEGLLPPPLEGAASGEDNPPVDMSGDLAEAIHRLAARTPSILFAVQLDDLVGSERQANLPGTTDEYPNWRIRSDVPLEDLAGNERFNRIAAALRSERPEAS
ncbi:4-alpha-glucanotransferase [Antarcticirhabdus aurantiaca]|uniref:4-alpha-glucanotransferase n=1 Tax=Antarcticirhabdus aurantiaca TaxID=2606717 RepID=A0ACD4NJ20_9HYPH|nr:4-alpha-glucanotransferase [Antarcticirhabdus aurantiaca]WAJ26736.1 4-alpha-glucanotransferase [Jeongeuplla avenae]